MPARRALAQARRFVRANLFSILLLVIAGGIMLAAIAAYLPAPGIRFALTAKVTGFAVRVAEGPAVIQDIDGNTVTVEMPASGGADGNVLDPSADASAPASPGDAGGRFTRLNSLIVREGGVIEFDHDRRTNTLSIVADADGTGDDLSLRLSRMGSGTGASGIATQDYRLQAATLIFEEPATSFQSGPPFLISHLQTELIDTSPTGSFSVSLIESGRLAFASFGNTLPDRQLEAGQTLRFTVLDAEMSAIAIGPDGIRFRLFGTADDVFLGYGVQFESIHPNLYDAVVASPVMQLVISTIAGLVLAVFGAVSFKNGKPEP